MEAEQRTEGGDSERSVPSAFRGISFARNVVRLWLIANICLFIGLYVRVRVFFPNTAAGECSVLLLLWDLVPLAGMLFLIQPRSRDPLPNLAMLVVVVGVSVYGTHEFVTGFYLWPTDPFCGFTQALVPFFQWLILLTAFLFSGAAGRRPRPAEGDDHQKLVT
jgi:hypothetical protein